MSDPMMALQKRVAKAAHDFILAHRGMLLNPREGEAWAEDVRRHINDVCAGRANPLTERQPHEIKGGGVK